MKPVKLNKMDRLFSRQVRERDKWTCQRCGKKHDKGSMGLHCSHFIGRAHKATRYDFENCDALCWGCHQYFETKKATEYRDWKIDQLGQKRYDELVKRGASIVQFGSYERKLKYEELKAGEKSIEA